MLPISPSEPASFFLTVFAAARFFFQLFPHFAALWHKRGVKAQNMGDIWRPAKLFWHVSSKLEDRAKIFLRAKSQPSSMRQPHGLAERQSGSPPKIARAANRNILAIPFAGGKSGEILPARFMPLNGDFSRCLRSAPDRGESVALQLNFKEEDTVFKQMNMLKGAKTLAFAVQKSEANNLATAAFSRLQEPLSLFSGRRVHP